MVTIKSSYVVIPSEPTPNGSLRLSECDQILPWTHTSVIFLYKVNTTDNTSVLTEAMRNSLSRALVHYYPLAGRLCWKEGSRLELDCNAKGARLLEAYSEQKLDDLGDFAPTEAVESLVPKADYTTPIEEWPLVLMQLTRFRCGGICVGFGISHAVADGMASGNFIGSIAKLARGDILSDHEMPYIDRNVLRSSEPLKAPRFEHIEFKEPPLVIGSLDSQAEQKKETSVTLLKITREQVEGLKKSANSEFPNGNVVESTRPYSRYEALASHLWRSACKARMGDDESQPTRARFLIDIRNRLKPPLPHGYFGNAVFPTVTSTCLYGDLISKPLSYAAGKLREAFERMTDEYVRSELDFVASQKDVTWLRADLRGNTKGPYAGNPNLTPGNWITLPLYDVDFGWGKPIYVGPGFINVDGRLFIMLSLTGDGSLTIALRFQTQYMDSFKKFFYEDMSSKKPFVMSSKL